MKTLITYASKTGTTKKAAALLAEKLGADVFDLSGGVPDLAAYETVVVGGSIRMGTLHSSAKRFLNESLDALKAKRYALFVCGCSPPDDGFFQNAFGSDALTDAVAVASFGGEMDMEKQKGADKLIVKMIQKTEIGKNMRTGLDEAEIKKFATALSKK